MIDYGPHKHLVSEVVDLVESGGILGRSFEPTIKEAKDTVIIRSWTRVDLYRDPDIENAMIEGDLNWIDIQRVDDERFPLRADDTEAETIRDRLWPALDDIGTDIFSRLIRIPDESCAWIASVMPY